MQDIKIELEKTIDFLKKELSKLRVGRVTPALVEDIKIDYYGTSTPLKQLATINTPESDLIVISPWDRSSLSAIEKSIAASSFGINPIVDKDIIRLKMPSLTEERRKEFAKLLHQHAEEARITMRNIREKIREEIKNKVEGGQMPKDEKFKKFEEVDELIKEYNHTINTIKDAKEKEIMGV